VARAACASSRCRSGRWWLPRDPGNPRAPLPANQHQITGRCCRKCQGNGAAECPFHPADPCGGMPAATSSKACAPVLSVRGLLGGDDHPVGQAGGNGPPSGPLAPIPQSPPQPNTQISRRCRRVMQAAKASQAIWACGRSRPAHRQGPLVPATCSSQPHPLHAPARPGMGDGLQQPGNARHAACSTPTACKQVHQVEAGHQV